MQAAIDLAFITAMIAIVALGLKLLGMLLNFLKEEAWFYLRRKRWVKNLRVGDRVLVKTPQGREPARLLALYENWAKVEVRSLDFYVHLHKLRPVPKK